MSILVFHPHSLKEKHDSIAVDGFCFRFNRAHVKNYAQEFRCCDDKCPARVLFNSCDDFVVLHEHVVCQFDHQKELRSRKRLDKAFDLLQKNPTDAPHKIVEKVQLLIDDELTENERRSLRAFVTRKRRELLGSPSNDPKELIIPDHLRVTATPVSPDHPDNSFLLFDSNEHQKDAPSRILIFASADMRFKASMATELFADGTYRIVPNGFATLYTIHSVINGVPYPVFFCLMQNEQEKTFLRVLNVVKAHLSRFDANCVVHTDCQRSAINAFKLTFGCKVKLCLFHINQALWRYVSKVGLASGYNDAHKPRLHAWIRRLMAFPFMKCERMAACFEECFETMAMDDVLGVEEEYRYKFRQVVTYYKRFWLDEIGPEMICQFDVANRTNNHAEAFHRGVGFAVQVAHPQTIVLIQLLINVEREALLRFNQQRTGKYVKRQNKRFEDLEKTIKNVMLSFDDGLYRNDSEYLSAISKVYVEYNYILKAERVRNNTNFLRHAEDVKKAVLKALDDQNNIIVGEELLASGSIEEPVFVEVDFNSEILFDTIPAPGDGEQSVVAPSLHPIDPESDVPMEICPDEEISTKRREETKPRPEGIPGGRTSEKRRRRTLIQRMKGK